MTLVSSPSLLLEKRVAAVTVFVGLISISCFGQPVFLTVSSTPYDRQMIRVYPALTSTNMQRPGPILSSLAVNHWMTELRAIPYQYSGHWQTPAEVNLAQTADCKGKAVALYAEMRRNGAKNVRVVIGKHHIYDSATHAWLEWETQAGSYMLDPTFNAMPIKTAELSPMTYVPSYAYEGDHKYRVANFGFSAPPPKVAAGYNKHFYAQADAGSTFAQSGLIRAGSGQSFSATTEYATLSPQPAQPNTQRSWSNTRSSSSNVKGLRQPGALAAIPNAKTPSPRYPQPDTQRSWSNAQISSSNIEGLRQPGALAAIPNPKTLSPRCPQPDTQRSWSNTRSSSSNLEGLPQPGALAATPNAKYMIPAHPRPAAAGRPPLTQKRPTSNARRSTSSAVRRRQGRRFAQNGKHVIQTQPRQLPPHS